MPDIRVVGSLDDRAVLDRLSEALVEVAVSYASARGLVILLRAARGDRVSLDCVSEGVLAELETAQLIARRGATVLVL